MTLLTLSEVAERTRLSRSTLYRLMKAGEFPKPRKASKRRVLWLTSDVEAWISGEEIGHD